MSRTWTESISPKYLHDNFGVYHGIWMPQMDRCWYSDDGYQVTSRIIQTEWGRVEHAAITFCGGESENQFSSNGERDIPWSIKQEIKNELFGEKRLAIEVYPAEKNKVDIMDVYHLWIFPKDFKLPFGLHPAKDKQCKPVNRGYPQNIAHLVEQSAEVLKTIYETIYGGKSEDA